MAEEQQLRQPKAGGGPIMYGEVFEMSGDMAGKPISPRDATAMESAENRAFGKTIKGGPASLMRSAAAINVQAGLIGPHDRSPAFSDHGLETKKKEMGREQEAGKIEGSTESERVTIGDALEAAATVIGDKPVDESDAAAIQAAEMRATGDTAPPPTGIGLQAQAAAMANARRIYDEDRTTLAEIIGDAKEKMESDKAVTKRDAARVKAAELQGDVGGHLLSDFPKEELTPGGVAQAIDTAATLNQPPSTST